MRFLASASRHVTLIAFALLIPLGFHVTAASAEIDTVYVVPAKPSAGDTVTVFLTFHYPDVCWNLEEVICGLNHEENTITVDIYATDSWQPGWGCALMLQTYTTSCIAGPLAGGTYMVIVKEHLQSLRTPGDEETVPLVVESLTPSYGVTWGVVKARFW